MARGLRRMSPVVLAIVGVVGLVIGRSVKPVTESMGKVAPLVPWATPLTLLFLAGVLAWLAWSTHQSVQRQKRQMASDRGVRLLALAKASALVGALIGGYYLGFAISFLGDLNLALPRERFIRSGVAFVGAGVAVVSGIFLERACEVPRPPDDPATGAPRAGTGG